MSASHDGVPWAKMATVLKYPYCAILPIERTTYVVTYLHKINDIMITIKPKDAIFFCYSPGDEIGGLLYYCAQSVFWDVSVSNSWCVEKRVLLHIGILMLSCNRFPVASMAAAPVASISHWCKSQLDYSTFEYCEFCWRFVLVRLAYWNLATNECHVFSVMQCKVQR